MKYFIRCTLASEKPRLRNTLEEAQELLHNLSNTAKHIDASADVLYWIEVYDADGNYIESMI